MGFSPCSLEYLANYGKYNHTLPDKECCMDHQEDYVVNDSYETFLYNSPEVTRYITSTSY